MNRPIFPVALSLVWSLLAGSLAQAEPRRMVLRCQHASPGSPELECTAEVEVRRDLADRTHTSIFPTGNLLRDGEVSFQLHELGALSRAAVGLTDNVELSVSAPLFPIFGGVGVRVGLLPRASSYRAVLSLGLWMPMIADEGDETVGQGSVTVAYQNERLNLHGSIGGFQPLDGEEDPIAFTYSAGLVYKLGRKAALIGEALRLAMGATAVDGCMDDGGDCSGSHVAYFDGALVGVKLMGEHFDTDLGLFVPLGDHHDVVGIPVVGMTYRY